MSCSLVIRGGLGIHFSTVTLNLFQGPFLHPHRSSPRWMLKQVQHDGRGGSPSPGAKSCQSGFSLSIRLIFHCRCQRFSCFSRAIASGIVANNSNRTSRYTPYCEVKPCVTPVRC